MTSLFATAAMPAGAAGTCPLAGGVRRYYFLPVQSSGNHYPTTTAHRIGNSRYGFQTDQSISNNPLPAGTYAFWLQQLGGAVSYQFDFVITGGMCYANCDGSTTPPVLNVNDFACFGARFAAGDSYANCDGSTTPPTLNINDFVCFLDRFAAGCT